MRRLVLFVLAALCLTTWVIAFSLLRSQSDTANSSLPTLMVLPSLTPTETASQTLTPTHTPTYTATATLPPTETPVPTDPPSAGPAMCIHSPHRGIPAVHRRPPWR